MKPINLLSCTALYMSGFLFASADNPGTTTGIISNISSMEMNGSTRLLNFMTESLPFNSECRDCHAFPICDGGCAYYRLRNLKEDACFPVCSSFKDFEKLKRALLNGIRPEQL